MEELQPKEITEWLKLIAQLLTLIPIGYALRWLKMRISKAFADTVSAVVLAQVMPVMEEILRKTNEVRHQVFPNGGQSMNDRLLQTLHSSERTETGVHLLRQTVRAHQDADLSQARFETYADGSFAWVSYALLRWCNKGIEQVKDWNWINCVHPDDRVRVRGEVESAVEEGREWTSSFRMRDVYGAVFRVDAFAKPIRDSHAKPEGWVGVFTKDCTQA